jgi:catechol 2,3-dioxygenase
MIEFGPGRHNATEGFFLYVREPGGNRVELFSGDNETLAPDQEPVVWRTSERPTMYWTGDMPPFMYSYATPPVKWTVPERCCSDPFHLARPRSDKLLRLS